MCSFIISYAQDRKELENKRNKTIEEISLANELLEKNQENRISNINQIRIVNKRIALRDELIKSLEEQIENLNSDIKENIEIIEELEKDYDKVKEEYSKLIYYTYWNRNKYNTLMYFFSSDNFNQAYKRMKYVQQLTKFRKRQIEEIELIKGELKKKIDELNIKAKGVEIVMNEKENERKSLEKEKKNKEIIMSDLRRKESKLREELKEKEEMRIQLENEITRLIEEERRKYRNEKGIRKLTPEEQLLSKNFIENKGKLPWPTERGRVTNKFGKHAHPILPGITIENNGIDINTIEGAEVRAMFDGTVTRIIPILGANYAVIIRHGEYLSVYQNIISVAVKKGDKVRTKQKLGIVYTDNETKDTMLHLELWKELEKQNPEIWLSK
jgi:septal ring factor EnvC (AmiA/AmiB activator)